MAERLTDKKRKMIIADYAESGSYRATAKKFGVADRTVCRICKNEPEITQKVTQKKAENTADMLLFMNSRKNKAQNIIDNCLNMLPEKLQETSAAQAVVVMGVLIDKFINNPIKNRLDERKLEIELLKLENQIKNNQPEEEADDNFLDALNSSATEVWIEGEKTENE